MDDLKKAHLDMIRAEIDLDHADYHGFSQDKIELLQEVWLACQAEYLRLKEKSDSYYVWYMTNKNICRQGTFGSYDAAYEFAFSDKCVQFVEISKNGDVVFNWELGKLK